MMIKLKEILSEQDNTIDKKEWNKVVKTVDLGLNKAWNFGIRHLRDYDRSNLPDDKKRIIMDLFNDFTKLQLKFEKVKKEVGKFTEIKEGFPASSLGSVKWSNPEAMKLSQDSVNKAAKIIGKAQGAAVTIFTSDLKQGKYDNLDLSKAIHIGNIRDASFSKREVLSKLYYDIKERFMKLGRRKKN